MPGGKFDKQLQITPHGCLTPKGPMTLDKDETALRLDVWVFQEDNAACAAVQHDFTSRTSWETNPNPDTDHTGPRFQAGPATAMALLVSRWAPDGRIEAFQWTQGVMLV